MGINQQKGKPMALKTLRSLAREQMCIDLEKLLEFFLKKDIGLRILSEKMEISQKTLKRVLQKSIDPRVATIDQFYSYFFNFQKIDETDNDFYQAVKELIEERHADEGYRVDKESKFGKIIKEDKVFRKILLFAASGKITAGWVKTQFGLDGLQTLNMMAKEEILLQLDKDVYTHGDLSILGSPMGIKAIMDELMVEHCGTGESDENFFMIDLMKNYKDKLNLNKVSESKRANAGFFLIDGVSEETRQLILEKMSKFRSEMAELILDPKSKGDLRFFILGAADVLKGGPQDFKF